MNVGAAREGFLRHCRVARNLSPHTIRAYDIDLTEFSAFVGATTGVAEVGRTQLRDYLTFLFDERGLKESSIKRRMACLKALFKWLEREEVVAIDPFHRLDVTIRLPKRLPRAMSKDELRALFRAAESLSGISVASSPTTSDVERAIGAGLGRWVTAQLALEILFGTGMRVGELCSVTLDRIDRRSGTISIMGKGARERRVFLTNTGARGLMEAYIAVFHALPIAPPPAATLLRTPRGNGASPQFIRSLFKTLGEAARLDRPITPHMLRHTAATQLIEAGVDIRFVQKLLGHQSIATTEIYTNVTDASLRGMIAGADVRAGVGR